MPGIQRAILATAASLFIAVKSHAHLVWISVDRTASAVIAPDLGSNVATSNQIMGWWSETVTQIGPWLPDPNFETALASATHTSNIGFGVVPWAYLAGTVNARHAVPSTFGLATAFIQMEAVFSIIGTEHYEMRNMIGSGFLPESQIQATLTRGEETLFSKIGAEAFTESGTLTEGTYRLSMKASFSNGDTGSNGITCDMRFTVPGPGGVAAILLGQALMRRRTSL